MGHDRILFLRRRCRLSHFRFENYVKKRKKGKNCVYQHLSTAWEHKKKICFNVFIAFLLIPFLWKIMKLFFLATSPSNKSSAFFFSLLKLELDGEKLQCVEVALQFMWVFFYPGQIYVNIHVLVKDKNWSNTSKNCSGKQKALEKKMERLKDFAKFWKF